MGQEDQVEEIDVLSSIFPDEITTVSAKEYRISIKLDISDDEEEHELDPVIVLHVRYPEAYPDVAPELDILKPASAAKYEHLDVSTDKDRLLESLDATIEESLGMAMVFTLVTCLKENTEQLVKERMQAITAERDAEIAKVEAEENKKFEGTKVTREAFLEWSRKFKLEAQEEEERLEREREDELKKKRSGKEEKKMTGKELWQKGLAGNTVDEDDGDDVLEAMQELEVK